MMASTDGLSVPERLPAGAAAPSGGIRVGDGKVEVAIYVDFLCPYCREFEERDGPTLDDLADRGLITLVFHPLGWLDRLSPTRYSTRAAAAAGCSADEGALRTYRYVLYDAQPPEDSGGLSDEELIRLGLSAGLDEGFGRCIKAGTYLPWAEYVTAAALARGVEGTPTVFVDGVEVEARADAIIRAADLGSEA